MKQFACSVVIPSCDVVSRGEDDGAVLAKVAAHAEADHGMAELPPEVVASVRENIEDV